MDRVRFVKLWSRCGGSHDGIDTIFDDLRASYAEPQRHYHTGAHIEHCLRVFDLGRHEMPDADAIELGLWFHDVEYIPQAADNELQSAERFRRVASGAMSNELIDQVYRLIMITVHDRPPGLLDEQFIVDIDLSSFGLPWQQFFADSEDVRAEFPALSDEVFYAKQRVFMGALLEREHFCFTEFFRRRHEDTARSNIGRHLALIEQRDTA